MVIVFVLLLWVIWLTMALALYANFLPYFGLLRDIKDYNMAYYGANTAIERSLLVLRSREPWFQSKWWWNSSQSFGVSSDNYDSNFSYFNNKNYINRDIASRATDGIIPSTWMWNSDIYNLSGWVWDYNILGYGQVQTIPIKVDTTSSAYAYNKENTIIEWFNGNAITIQLKLPSAIREELHNQWLSSADTLLCIDSDCDVDGDGVLNDAIVWWTLQGTYDDWTRYDFTILPRNLVGRLSTSPEVIVFSSDETIRESDINLMTDYDYTIDFGDKINPLYSTTLSSALRATQTTWHVLIGSDVLFSGVWLNEDDFSDIYTNPKIKDLNLKLTLNNKLISNSRQIYPFLEYKIIADGAKLSQPFFYVKWEAKVWEYTVKMNLVRPIDKQNVINSFTVIF